MLDADSRPEKGLLNLIANKCFKDSRIYQFPSKYTLNMSELSPSCKYEAIRQSAWSFGTEYFFLKNTRRIISKLYFPYVVGHGLLMKVGIMGNFYKPIRDLPVEDFAVGYMAMDTGEKIISMPFFDVAKFVDSPKKYIEQSAIWFRYSLFYLNLIKNKFKTFPVMLRSLFWATRGPFWAILTAISLIQSRLNLLLVLTISFIFYQMMTSILYCLIFERKNTTIALNPIFALESFILRSIGPLESIIQKPSYKKTNY
jgi:hypothetical protein